MTPAAPEVSLPQIKAPVESVVILPLPVNPVQFNVPIVIPPAETLSPPLKVEVDWLVNWIPPPMTFNPPAVSNPAVPVAAMPELNVEVAPVPPTLITPWMVEEAPMIAEEEAFNSPPTCKLAEKVEDALDINPEEKV